MHSSAALEIIIAWLDGRGNQKYKISKPVGNKILAPAFVSEKVFAVVVPWRIIFVLEIPVIARAACS